MLLSKENFVKKNKKKLNYFDFHFFKKLKIIYRYLNKDKNI